MKSAAWTVMMIAAATEAYAGHGSSAAERKVVVCSALSEVGPAFGIANGKASSMFAQIGVKLEWRDPSRCPSSAIRINLSSDAPAGFRTAALAYALPYEGTHIVVFWNRVLASVEKDKVATLLAHVVVHEITHILQGVPRHSDSGVMKAHWDVQDLVEMARKPLAFTPTDIDLIRIGMDRRNARLTASRQTTQYHGQAENSGLP